LLRVHDWWSTTAAPAPLGGGKSGLYPFLDQRALVLGERAEHREQEFALRVGRVHRLGELTERDAPSLQDRRQVRQRAAEPVRGRARAHDDTGQLNSSHKGVMVKKCQQASMLGDLLRRRLCRSHFLSHRRSFERLR